MRSRFPILFFLICILSLPFLSIEAYGPLYSSIGITEKTIYFENEPHAQNMMYYIPHQINGSGFTIYPISVYCDFYVNMYVENVSVLSKFAYLQYDLFNATSNVTYYKEKFVIERYNFLKMRMLSLNLHPSADYINVSFHLTNDVGNYTLSIKGIAYWWCEVEYDEVWGAIANILRFSFPIMSFVIAFAMYNKIGKIGFIVGLGLGMYLMFTSGKASDFTFLISLVLLFTMAYNIFKKRDEKWIR